MNLMFITKFSADLINKKNEISLTIKSFNLILNVQFFTMIKIGDVEKLPILKNCGTLYNGINILHCFPKNS